MFFALVQSLLAIVLHKNIFCDPPLQPSRDNSYKGSQCMFSLRNRKITFELSSIPPLSGALQTFKLRAELFGRS